MRFRHRRQCYALQIEKTNVHDQNNMIIRVLLALLACLPLRAQAQSRDLVMVAPLNQSMPYAHYESGKITAGIIKDFSEAIAQRAGRRIVFVSVASQDVSAFLRAGKADGICHVQPHWIDGDYHWSRKINPDAELIASHLDAPVVRTLSDLRDRTVGTVVGYRYPRIELVLGVRLKRDDSQTMEENLKKMMGTGARHTIVGRNTLAYQMRINPALRLRADLVFAQYSSQCAFSKQRDLPLADLDKAIDSLAADGSFAAIVARYR